MIELGPSSSTLRMNLCQSKAEDETEKRHVNRATDILPCERGGRRGPSGGGSEEEAENRHWSRTGNKWENQNRKNKE